MVIHVGCCGFPKSNEEYYQHFQLVEIQKSFSKPPLARKARTLRLMEAPTEFVFTLLAWQLITHTPDSPTYREAGLNVPEASARRYGHFRPSEEVLAAWEGTLEIAQILDAPAVVFRSPQSFTPSDENKRNMRAFFQRAERDDRRMAWLPPASWEDEDLTEICKSLELVHCVDPFDRRPVTGDLAYFRLGGRKGRDYQYTDEDLKKLLTGCRQFEEAFVLFGNASMWDDALRFKGMLEKG